MTRKVLAALLAVILLAGLILPAAAEEAQDAAADTETIRITSAEDLLTFAKNCALDSWSQNKQVLLETNISLEGTDFAPIPTFGGSFDGGGHTISGLTVDQSITPAGLFGTLQPTAVVKNLIVCGDVAPGGDGLTVGGIVGENYGTAENCTFTGTVVGKTNTGGIAGMNYGTLRSCRAEGSVTGDNRTGGIAGYNSGVIVSCHSDASVNTESVDPTIDPKDIRLNFNMDFSKAANLDASDAASDTGGIAGYSSGTVTDCVNTGSVGYPHIGYNLGGIVGRSCGFVESCRNEGFITGRKDVGGVVGQIEPHIQTILSPDYLETLSKQFENLGGLVSRAGSHGADMGGDVQSSIQIITGYQSSARSSLESLVSGAVSGGEVNEEALSSLGSAVQGMANASGDLRNAIGQGVDTMTNDISAISGQISAISRTFALATEDAKKETVTDISEVNLEDITEGKVFACVNSGAVEGDLNVGGITGVMGLESTADPEDDAPSGNLTQRRRYELKAIVLDCENMGKITGKRSYVGGICGRMELGLISDSRGYGTISSENGDYVGGIAGLTGGTIRSCLAKCTLSGSSYIGGIVGSGIAEDYSGDSSTVTDCYSMVEIPEYEQYVGAIAGVNTGVFTGNYFVSDTLAGINRVSYFALAEPISYDALHRAEVLPSPLKAFTLSFVVDGETIKTVPFHYRDSFDVTVFPEIPQKEGCYAQWSTTDLTDLRFDTVVEAAYYPYITALNAAQLRSEGKPMLFVQGQFKDGDSLVVAPGTTAFPETEDQPLLEQWHISIPADGLESHTIRYLPTQENIAVYVLRNGNWSKVSTESMGSYLAFEAVGAEVEIAVTVASAANTRWMIPAAAALLLLILGIVLRKKRTRGESPKNARRKHWLIPVLLLLACAAVVCLYIRFPQTKTGQSIQAYDILKTYLEQPEQQMRLTVKAQIEEKDAGFTAQISRVSVGDAQVTVISEGGRRLYYAGDVVFLDDGAAFRLNNAAPDYSALLENMLEVCKQVDISAVDEVYTITAEGSQVKDILKLLMPSAQALLPEANRLTVDLITENSGLSQLRFTGAGNLTDSVKTPFSLSAIVEILPASGNITIPNPVAQAVSTGKFQAQEMYSDDLVRLIDAWTQIRSKNPVAAGVTLEAYCGELTVSDAFAFYQWKESGNTIRAMEKEGKTCYFTDSAVCDENGRKVSASAAGNPDLAKLLDIALGNIENTEFKCHQEEGASVYTFVLNQAGMEQLVSAVFPKAEKMEVSYEKGSICLVIEDGKLQSVDISFSGSGKILAASMDVQLSLKAQLRNEGPGPTLPDAVKQALRK